ncbi:MAG: ComEC/Rec2 family competence protein [Pseudomonadota bacterium]
MMVDWLAPEDRRRTLLWFPVFMGIGIAVYFELDREPSILWCGLFVFPLAFILSGNQSRRGFALHLLSWCCFGIGLGFATAYLHTHLWSLRMLDRTVTETVEGRVVEVSRSASGAARAVLDRVYIHGVEPSRTPGAVRVSLTQGDVAPDPGTRIRLYARLAAPEGPVEPGGYDFRRQAYFQGLGGIGYALGVAIPVTGRGVDSLYDRLAIGIARLRAHVSQYLRRVLPGNEGAFAAAIVVGDRSHIDESDSEALRAANLSHLLAISGLHMGMLTGLVFFSIRLVLSSIEWVALRYPIKKIAALCALLAAAGYLALSGATVATQRAFIMVAVALIAVLFDRRAITLRAIAVAATIVLLLRPISLLEPGFQMSFAATTVLVAGYGVVRDEAAARRTDTPQTKRSFQRRIGRQIAIYVGGLIFTSILAGLATAPFAAYNFNRTAPYGLFANLAAVPAMGLIVAPSAMMAGIAAPFGVAGPFLKVMGTGIGAILDIAHEVASWPGAVRATAALPVWTIAAFSLGVLWLCIWQGRWRFFGLIGPALAVVVWSMPGHRPEVLAAPGGRLLGSMGPEGRSLDHSKSANFIAKSWLRRDGDLGTQADAFERVGISRVGKHASAQLANGWRVVVVARKGGDPETLPEQCLARTLFLVFTGPAPTGDCEVLSGKELSNMGALAIESDGDGIRVTAARGSSERPWLKQPPIDQ